MRSLSLIPFVILLMGCPEESNQDGSAPASVSTQKTTVTTQEPRPAEATSRPASPVLAKKKTSKAIRLARKNVENVSGAVTVHALSKGGPPRSLEILVDEGHLKRSNLKDPWGQSLRLELRNAKGHTHRVCSAGPDRRFKTSDDVCVSD